MITASLYILIILITAFFAETFNKKSRILSNIYLIITSLLLTLFVGLRYSGTDFLVYHRGYFRIQNSTFLESLSNGEEPGTFLLIKLASFFAPNDSTLYFILMAALVNFIFCFGVKKYTNKITLSIFLYILSYTYFTTFNIALQFISIMITFYGIEYLIKNQKKKYILNIAIAFCFHYTSLIMLVLLLIPRKTNTIGFKTLSSLFFIGLFVFLGYPIFALIIEFVPLLGPKYSLFLDQLYTQRREANVTHLLIWIAEAIAIYWFYRVYSRNNENNYERVKYYYFTMIFMISGIFTFLSITNLFWIRLAEFFNIYSLILIPAFLSAINKKERIIIAIVLIALYSIVCVYLLLSGSGEVYPFRIRVFDNIYNLR